MLQYTLAPTTSKKLYTIPQSIFTFAVNQNYIKESPARGVILPSKDVTKDDKRKYTLDHLFSTIFIYKCKNTPDNTFN